MQRQLWNQLISEHFDIAHGPTRRYLVSLDEAEQTQVLSRLSEKLYEHILKRTYDIDFGLIPSSKGDITKIPNYLEMVDCLTIIHELIVENKQSTYATDTVFAAIENMKKYKDLWTKGFQLDSGLPVMMYNTTCLSIVSAVSLLLSTCINYVKDTETGTIEMALSKTVKAKSSEGLLFRNLAKFNDACRKGEIEKTINQLYKTQVQVKESVDVMTESIGFTVGAIIGLMTCILPFLHEVTSFLFCLRQSVSDYFAMEAEAVRMNIYKLEHDNTKSESEKKKIIAKQTKAADKLKKWSDKLAIKATKAEKEAIAQINDDKKEKTTIDDRSGESDDNGGTIF